MTDGDILESRDAGDKIIRGGSLRSVTYVVGVLAGLVAAPLVVRYLGTGDYGHYVTVMSIVFIVTGVTEAGLSSVGVREYVARNAQQRRRLLSSLAGLRIALACAGLAIAVVFTVIAGYPNEVAIGTALSAFYLVLGALSHTWMLSLQVDLRIGWLSLIDLLRALAVMLFLLAVVLLDAGFLALLLAQGFAAALALVVTAALVRGAVPLLPAYDRAQWGELLRQTGVYATATLFGIVYFQVAVIATSLLSTELQTSFFGLAFRVIDILNGVPWLLVATAFPLLAHAAIDDHERFRYALRRMFEVALIVGGWFALSLVVGAPFIVDVMGGDDFEPAVGVLQIAAFAVPCTFLLATWSFSLLSLRRHRALVLANAAAVAFSIALSLILIPSRGAEGSAIVTLCTEALLATLYCIALVRHSRDLAPPLRPLVLVVLATAVALAVGLLPSWHPVIGVLAAGATYWTLIAATGTLPREVLEAFSSRRRSAAGVPPPPPALP